jgi:hypothetical protein
MWSRRIGALIAVLLTSPALAGEVSAPLAASPPANFGGFWIEADALGWSVKGDPLPPLVTTSPIGTPALLTGVLGAPATSILFGGSSVNDGWRPGGRLQAGYWFDPQHRAGIEASFFGLPDVTNFNANSAADPILARPFLNALTNRQDSLLAATPGVLTGAISASETSRLIGAGALYRQDIGRQEIGAWGEARFSALVGYRFLQSSDNLNISQAGNVNAGFATGSIGLRDNFGATSNFHGLDLGIASVFDRGPWTFEVRTKVALGANFSDAKINGATTTTFGGVTTNSSGGLLALSSNSGSFAQTRFAAVPELALKAGYRIAPGWTLVAGYDLLYWTSVQRAGNLIDTTINPNLLAGGIGGGLGTGPQRPQPVLGSSPLLAQGFSLGLRYEFGSGL